MFSFSAVAVVSGTISSKYHLIFGQLSSSN